MICSFTFCFLLVSFLGFAQEKRNAIYAEVGGNAYYYSINYEKTFSNCIAGRLGVGGTPRLVVIPGLIGKYFGKGAHHPEIMAGGTYIYIKQNDFGIIRHRNQLFATAFIGYRFQHPEKRFLLRVGYTPLYKILDSDSGIDQHFLFHWAGAGFGFRFK